MLHVSTFLCHHLGVLQLCLANLYNRKFKNLCILARHKCKTPWWWHRNVETCSSIYDIKLYCCDINCAFVGCDRNNSRSVVIYIYIYIYIHVTWSTILNLLFAWILQNKLVYVHAHKSNKTLNNFKPMLKLKNQSKDAESGFGPK